MGLGARAELFINDVTDLLRYDDVLARVSCLQIIGNT